MATSLCVWHSCFLLSSCSLLKLQSGVCCLLAVVGCSKVLGITSCTSRAQHCMGLLFKVAWWMQRWCGALDQRMYSKTLQFSGPKLSFGFPLYLYFQFLIWCFFLFLTVINHLLCSSTNWMYTWSSGLWLYVSAVRFWIPYLDAFQGACSRWGCLVQPLVSSVTGCRLCSSFCYPDAYRLLSNSSPCFTAQLQ